MDSKMLRNVGCSIGILVTVTNLLLASVVAQTHLHHLTAPSRKLPCNLRDRKYLMPVNYKHHSWSVSESRISYLGQETLKFSLVAVVTPPNPNRGDEVCTIRKFSYFYIHVGVSCQSKSTYLIRYLLWIVLLWETPLTPDAPPGIMREAKMKYEATLPQGDPHCNCGPVRERKKFDSLFNSAACQELERVTHFSKR